MHHQPPRSPVKPSSLNSSNSLDMSWRACRGVYIITSPNFNELHMLWIALHLSSFVSRRLEGKEQRVQAQLNPHLISNCARRSLAVLVGAKVKYSDFFSFCNVSKSIYRELLKILIP